MSHAPDNGLADIVGAALRRLDSRAPTGPVDTSRIRRAVRRRQLMVAGPAAIVVAVAAILAGVTLTGPHGRSAAGPSGTSACAPLHTGPLPVWARSGFTGDSYPPFATSASGNLVAIVFGDPLSAPPADDHNNKILWVQRNPNAYQMTVTAHLEGTDRLVHEQIPVGPSIVDMPGAGCWVMDLRIGDHHDQIALRWAAP
jgi:hypothetical protein